MKMKKYLLGLAVLVSGMAVFTSCLDSNGDGSSTQTVAYSDGAYVVNSGNMYSNIESSLTHVSFSSNTATQNAFKSVNGRSLGNTANDGIVYGDKIYLVVDQSNSIEVVDKKTLKSVKQISTTGLMGTSEGNEPRHIIAGNGNIYFTTYGGYVGVVDTLNYSLQAKYQVGKYPEEIIGYGTNLYVANSNYAQGGGNISSVNLQTGVVTTYDVEGINNPTKLFIANSTLYVLDNMYYDLSNNSYGENALKSVNLISKTSSKIIECNYACLYAMGNSCKFYVINAPYTGEAPTYKTYDLTTSQTASLTLGEEVKSPCGINVDPMIGYLYILSYNLGDGGYADYNSNGYMIQYDNTGKKLHQYEVGVGPCTTFFDSGYKTVTVNQ